MPAFFKGVIVGHFLNKSSLVSDKLTSVCSASSFPGRRIWVSSTSIILVFTILNPNELGACCGNHMGTAWAKCFDNTTESLLYSAYSPESGVAGHTRFAQCRSSHTCQESINLVSMVLL